MPRTPDKPRDTDPPGARHCRRCGRMILDAPSRKTPGTTIPLDLRAPVYSADGTRLPHAFVTHFATCPEASSFGKGAATGEASGPPRRRTPDFQPKPGSPHALITALAAGLLASTMLCGCSFVRDGPRQPDQRVPLPDSGIITPPRNDQSAFDIQ